MFCSEATFHHVTSLSLESVLEATGWTDVLRVDVEDQVVYEDRLGLADDLLPALDAVRDLYLEGRATYTVSLGRSVDTWQHVSRIAVNPLGIRWQKSARDLRLDRGPEETEHAHHDRIAAWVEQGYLREAVATVRQQVETDIRNVDAAGLPYNDGSLRGPWLLLLGEEPTDAFGYLHHLFLKGDVPPEANRVLLDLLGRGLYRPGREVEVRVDHLDTTQLLREYRDTLVMLDTPLAPLTYDENGGLEARK